MNKLVETPADLHWPRHHANLKVELLLIRDIARAIAQLELGIITLWQVCFHDYVLKDSSATDISTTSTAHGSTTMITGTPLADHGSKQEQPPNKAHDNPKKTRRPLHQVHLSPLSPWPALTPMDPTNTSKYEPENNMCGTLFSIEPKRLR